MTGKKLIQKLTLQNFLSYSRAEIELQPLNVLIGPNGSGKSNLIEAFSLLKALPTNLLVPIRKGGGVNEFLWKGENKNPTAQIGIVLNEAVEPIDYQLSFTSVNQRLEIVNEVINGFTINKKHYNAPNKSLIAQGILSNSMNFEDEQNNYEAIFALKNQLSEIALYRNWHIGNGSVLRKPQQTDLPEHPLEEEGSNLGLVLNDLQYQLGSQQILEQFQKFYENAEELSIKIYGGTVQIFIREKGLSQPIPAPRLSDG